MDNIIRRFDFEQDADLRLCLHRGIAYQADMTLGRVAYDRTYLTKVEAYDAGIAHAVNAARCAFVAQHLQISVTEGNPRGTSLLDIGAGSCGFLHAALNAGFDAKGYDVIPEVDARLREDKLYSDDPEGFDAVCMWDTLEHLEEPQAWLKRIRRGSLLFVSIPVFDDLRAIRESKHYRPGEHFYYFTNEGFIAYMAERGFSLVGQSNHEIEAGREGIQAYAFRADLPDYNDHLAAYKEMHATRHYGSSATELYLDTAKSVVKACAPHRILDYGCGRSDLVAHFWLEGKREIARYDPAIPAYKRMPQGHFDLVFCCDVLEHIPLASVDRVLAEIKAATETVLFTISVRPARAKLPDGRNAHVTLLTKNEWMNWIGDIFGAVIKIPVKWEDELALLACRPADAERFAHAGALP